VLDCAAPLDWSAADPCAPLVEGEADEDGDVEDCDEEDCDPLAEGEAEELGLDDGLVLWSG
jgi:hypothetical protein